MASELPEQCERCGDYTFNRAALAELIRKREAAAWDEGAAAHERDSWAVNPYRAKGGE